MNRCNTYWLTLITSLLLFLGSCQERNVLQKQVILDQSIILSAAELILLQTFPEKEVDQWLLEKFLDVPYITFFANTKHALQFTHYDEEENTVRVQFKIGDLNFRKKFSIALEARPQNSSYQQSPNNLKLLRQIALISPSDHSLYFSFFLSPMGLLLNSHIFASLDLK